MRAGAAGEWSGGCERPRCSVLPVADSKRGLARGGEAEAD
jgi:hypothetical protein